MPNWTFNNLKMKGLRKEDLFTEEGEFDFDKIIPEPRKIEDCPEEFNLDKHPAPVQKLEDRPWFNWYDWRVENWGTKWCAGETFFCKDGSISFQTAWAPPLPVILELSKRYPERVIKFSYYDEDYHGHNYLTIQNGEMVSYCNRLKKEFMLFDD